MNGLIRSVVRALGGKGRSDTPDPVVTPRRVSVEALEQRVLFDAQVNSSLFDASGIQYNTNLSGQSESATLAFSPPGSAATSLVTAYNDGAMAQFAPQSSGPPSHITGWSYSSNNGASFSQSSADPSNPPVLPFTSSTSSQGDGGDPMLAFNKQDGRVYLSTVSDWPFGEINVYRSSDYGQTFSTAMDATPGGPSASEQTYDKPSIAIDNTPGSAYGSAFGTVWVAYRFLDGNSPQRQEIVLTSLAPNSSSWPSGSSSQPPGVVVASIDSSTIEVQAPIVLVAPDHSVYVLYLTEANDGTMQLCAKHSFNSTSSNGWGSSTFTAIATLRAGGPDFNLQAQKPDDTYQDTIQHVNQFPSALINTVNGVDHILIAYADRNSDNETAGVYFLNWVPSSTGAIGDPTRIGQISGINDDWQPALAVSPLGNYAFIGFYGGSGQWLDGTYGYEAYNAYGITGTVDTSTGSVNWGIAKQLSNLDSSGLPTSNKFASAVGQAAFLGDYDIAAADTRNFFYTFAATTPETFSDNSTTDAQTDVRMAVVPIPYIGTAPPAPTGIQFSPINQDGTPNTTGGTLTWNTTPYAGTNSYVYAEYSTPTQGWVPLSGSALATASGGLTVTIPNYFADTTYYFRLRAQNQPNSSNSFSDANSNWSGVTQSWGNQTPSIQSFSYYSTGTNVVGQHTEYTYDAHLTFSWLGTMVDHFSARLQWRASDSDPWKDLATIFSANGEDTDLVYLTLMDTPLSTTDEIRLQPYTSTGGNGTWSGTISPTLVSTSDEPVKPVISSAYMTNGNTTLVVNWNGSDYLQGVDSVVAELIPIGSDAYTNDPNFPDHVYRITLGTYPDASYGTADFDFENSEGYYLQIEIKRDGAMTSAWSNAGEQYGFYVGPET